jgi:hypothetical protein
MLKVGFSRAIFFNYVNNNRLIPGAIASVVKGKEKLKAHVISSSKGHGQCNVISQVVACHVERKGINTRTLGGSNLSSPVIQAKRFGVAHLRRVRGR